MKYTSLFIQLLEETQDHSSLEIVYLRLKKESSVAGRALYQKAFLASLGMLESKFMQLCANFPGSNPPQYLLEPLLRNAYNTNTDATKNKHLNLDAQNKSTALLESIYCKYDPPTVGATAWTATQIKTQLKTKFLTTQKRKLPKKASKPVPTKEAQLPAEGSVQEREPSQEALDVAEEEPKNVQETQQQEQEPELQAIQEKTPQQQQEEIIILD